MRGLPRGGHHTLFIIKEQSLIGKIQIMKNKFLNTWLQRAAAVLLVFLGSMSSALADTKLYIEDFSINDGEEKKVAVCLDTDKDDICFVQMTVNLPAGLEFVKDGTRIKMSTEGTRAGSGMTAESAWNNGNIMFNDLMRATAVKPGTGAIFYIYVKETGLVGAQDITITNALLKCQDKSQVADVTVAPGVATKNGAVSPSNISLSFAESNVTMDPGSTKQISVTMDNTGKEVQGFQSTLVLPAGFTAEVSSTRGNFSYNAESGKIINVEGVTGSFGEVLNITLTAPSTFTGSAQVELTDTKVTINYASENIADIAMTVTSTEAQAAKPSVNFIVESTIIGAGKTGDVDVLMTNLSTQVDGFQANLVLPEGWTATLTPQRGAYTYNANTGKILNYTGVTGEEGAMFTLSITTPEEFEGEATVKLTNIKATVNMASVSIDDITLTVKAKDAAAKAAADEIIADLKEKFEAAKADMAEEDAIKIAEEIAALEADVQAKYDDATLEPEDVFAAAEVIGDEIDAAVAAKAEADAKAAAEAKLAELKEAAEALKVSDEAKAYEAENVQAAVAAAEEAITAANDAVAAVEAVIAEGNLATDNKEALAEAIAAAEKAIADAQAAIEVAEKTYAEQKAADDAAAAEAKAKALALEAQAMVKAAAEKAKEGIAPEVADDADVKAAAAVLDANLAALDNAIDNAETFKDNKTIAAAQKAAEDAVAALNEKAAAAKEAYDKAQAEAAEAAAKEAADAKLAELKAAAEAVAVSDEAKAYEAENVQAAVAAAEKAIADANDAVKAVEDKIAEGNLSTDNKDALAEAIAAAEQAVADAKTAAEAAEKAYADQKKADEDAAAAEAAAKEAADAKLAELKAAAEAAKNAVPAEVADDETVKAAADALDQALADLATAIADAETFKDNEDIAAAQKAAEDAVAALKETAAAAKEAYDKAQAEKKAANEAAYNKLSNQIAGLQNKLDMAKMTVDASCPDVADNFEDKVKAIQDQIDALKAALDAAYAAVELNADSQLDAEVVASIEEQISGLVKEAGKEQAAFVENREAYNRLTSELNDVKDDFADAMAIITDKTKYPDAEENLAEDIAAVQKMIDDAAAEIQAGYEAGTLNAESTIDAPAIKKAIADLLEKAKLVGIASIRTVENAETYYDLNGRVLSAPRAGQTVIVRMKDGSTKKVNLR